MRIIIGLLLTLCSTVAFTQSLTPQQVLNEFHHAASIADSKSYLALLDNKAIFLGTDASERWNKHEFAEFVKPYFATGKGWRYISKQRNLTTISDTVIMFDELLHNQKYGECRGSGVLIKTKHGWKIAQYNLSVPLPNAISSKILPQIKLFNQAAHQ